jgi:hypothetical protein
MFRIMLQLDCDFGIVGSFWGCFMVPSVAAVSSWCSGSGLVFAGAFVVRRSVRSVSGWVVVLSFRSVAAGVCGGLGGAVASGL